MSSKLKAASISIVLLLILLVPLIPACKPVKPADGYTAVVPAVLQAGSAQAISIALFNAGELTSGKVQLSLIHEGKQVFAAKDNVQGNDQLKFTVPDVPEGSYTLQIKGDSFSDEATVRIENKFLVFIESDKPIYKPGQTIHMRVITLNADLVPLSEAVTIEMLDAKGIKIYRSVVETDDYGTAALDMPLSTEPNLGTWKITAVTAENKSELDVRVEEYVLPKYEVKVSMPREWFLVNEAITGSVDAAYTFGKPVQGDLEIKAWRYVGQWEVYYTYNTSIDGQAEFSLPAAGYVAGVPAAGGNGNVKLDVTVVEKNTGYTEATSQLLTVSESPVNVSIIPSGVVYKPGLPFSFLIVTETPDNQLVEEGVSVNIAYYDKDFSEIGNEAKYLNTVKGKALLDISPPDGSIAMTINASTQGSSASKTIEAGYSPSGNFIHLEQTSDGTPKVGQTVSFKVYSTKEAANFYYEVISRGRVVFSDYTRNPLISFQVIPQMAPSARLLVYQVLPNSEVAADYLPFDVTAQYPQDISIDFNNTEPQPGDDIEITIKTDGKSKVGIAAVDKSVFILAENRMNLQQVFDKLEELYMTPQAELHEVTIYDDITTRGAKEIFNDAGVIVLSNNNVPEGETYKQQVMREGGFFLGGAMPQMDNAAEKAGAVPPPSITLTQAPTTTSAGQLAEVQRIRQYFPETWLWQDVTTDSHGKATVNATVPDSITTWVLRAVALSREKGLGIAESQLTVFQPFFLSIDLPYSAIRGEEFPVKVSVYNYLDQPQDVVVQIQSDEWFDLLDTAEQTINIGAGDIGSTEFTIRPKSLGTNNIKITARSKAAADAVIKTIIIEPEGVSRETVDNLVIAAGSRTADTTIPAFAIDGSGRAYFAVTSSYLAQTMDGLESLIQMPFGCGEQNMIIFAPDVFITKYLEQSGQLKPEIMAKAEKLMITGYQRELTYRHNDGSFSAFGENDESGSLWLTAFVLKSFSQAKDLIYIDDSILSDAINWIKQHQNSDGSFDIVGMVIHQDMMGGLQGRTALTAYVTTALMEAGEKTASAKAVAYLESQLNNIDDAYTMALTAYALELAGSVQSDAAHEKLLSMAQEDEDGLHWGDTSVISEADSRNVARPALIMPVENRTASIETTAYALMTLNLYKDNLDAGKTAKWLVAQRNAYGGYGSTQDTVVALEALTKFAAGSRSDVDLTVLVKAGEQTLKTLKLNSSNYDVMQVVDLPVNQQITVDVNGNGEAIGQVVRRYNLPEVDQTERDILKIDVNYNSDEVEVNDLVRVSVNVSFNPPEPMQAGMTVVDISVPTGFEAVTDSVALAVKQDPNMKRYDISGRKVIFYLEDMNPGDKVSFSFDVKALYPVKAKGTVSTTYSYYQPEISSETLGHDMTVR